MNIPVTHTYFQCRKRLSSETDKPLASNSSKRFFSELKKKGSTISIFGGLSSNTSALNPPVDPLDPFEYSSEVPHRKLESTSSSSGQSMRSGDGGASEFVGAAQEDVDQGKVHISLGI